MPHKHLIASLVALLCSLSVIAQSTWTKAPVPGQSDVISMDHAAGVGYLLNTSGLYKTTDEGVNWSFVPGSPSLLALRPADVAVPIVIHAVSASILYALVPRWSSNASSGVENRLYRSINGGATWSLMRDNILGYTDQTQNHFLAKGDTLITVDNYEQGIYSTDNGLTWKFMKNGANNLVGIYRLRNIGDRIYAASRYSYLYTGTDFSNWTIDTFPNYPRIEVLGSLLVVRRSLNQSLLVLQNAGEQWTTIMLPEATPDPDFFIDMIATRIFYQAKDSSILYHSDDLGASWSPSAAAGYAPGGPDYWMVAGGNLVNGNRNGTTVSTNLGEGFVPVNGVDNKAFITCFARSGDDWYAGTKHGLFVSHTAGQTWQKVFGEPDNYLSLPREIVAYGDLVIVPTLNRTWVSKDRGATWTEQQIYVQGAGYTQCISASGDGYIHAFGGPTKYRHSGDGAASWQGLFCPVANDPIFIDAEAQRVVIGRASDEAFFSNDHGDTWQPLPIPLPVPQPPASNEFLLRTKVSAEDIYLLTTKRLYQGNTTGNWTTIWQNAISDTNNINLELRTFLFKVKDALYVGFQGKKMQMSLDNGASWSNWTGFPVGSVFQTAYVDETLVVAGMDNGLYWRANDLPAFGGKVFVDTNGNGLPDPDEAPIPGAIVYTSDGQHTALTGTDGRYQFVYDPSPGSLLQVKPPVDYYTASTAGWTITSPGDHYDFGIVLTPGVIDQSIAAAGLTDPKPGYTSQWVLTYANVGTAVSGGTVALTLNPPFQFVSAEPPPTSVVDNILTWAAPSIPVFGAGSIFVQLSLPPDAVEGTTNLGTATIFPATGNDPDLADNKVDIIATIVDSYDPNDKLVAPAGPLSPQMVLNGQRLVYTVRFQNTGTGAALRVRISDTLDQNLVIQSLELLGSSHPVKWQLRGQGILECTFDNIDLPPVAQDEAGSQGFVQFALLAKNDLSIGDEIQNRAHIYFDYNAPIVTNRVTNLVVLPTSTQSPNAWLPLYVYPSPASDQINLDWQGGQPIAYQVYSATGILFSSGTVQSAETRAIPVQSLAPGTYSLVFQYQGKMVSRTFVKI